jgi:integrase/recombinase XerD
MLFYKYIHEVRPKLKTMETISLILTKSGTPEQVEGISYLLETSKHLFPERKLNTKTIRQSVATNRLKLRKQSSVGTSIYRAQIHGEH